MTRTLTDIWNEPNTRNFIGTLLKSVRESRKLSQEEVANALKFNVAFIQAIETGEWLLLPTHPYGQGFIRSYFRYLNIDIDLCLNDEVFVKKLLDDLVSPTQNTSHITEHYTFVKENTEPTNTIPLEAPILPLEGEGQVLEELLNMTQSPTVYPLKSESLSLNLATTGPLKDTDPLTPLLKAASSIDTSLPTSSTHSPSLSRASQPQSYSIFDQSQLSSNTTSSSKRIKWFETWSQIQTDLRKRIHTLTRKLKTPSLRTLYIQFLLIAAVIGSGFILHHFLLSSHNQTVQVLTPSSDTLDENTTETSSSDASKTESQAEPLKAQIIVRHPCQIRIDLDGHPWQNGLLNPATYDLTFQNEAKIFVQNGHAVELVWQGWNHGPLGLEGRKRILHLVRHTPDLLDLQD